MDGKIITTKILKNAPFWGTCSFFLLMALLLAFFLLIYPFVIGESVIGMNLEENQSDRREIPPPQNDAYQLCASEDSCENERIDWNHAYSQEPSGLGDCHFRLVHLSGSLLNSVVYKEDGNIRFDLKQEKGVSPSQKDYGFYVDGKLIKNSTCNITSSLCSESLSTEDMEFGPHILTLVDRTLSCKTRLGFYLAKHPENNIVNPSDEWSIDTDGNEYSFRIPIEITTNGVPGLYRIKKEPRIIKELQGIADNFATFAHGQGNYFIFYPLYDLRGFRSSQYDSGNALFKDQKLEANRIFPYNPNPNLLKYKNCSIVEDEYGTEEYAGFEKGELYLNCKPNACFGGCNTCGGTAICVNQNITVTETGAKRIKLYGTVDENNNFNALCPEKQGFRSDRIILPHRGTNQNCRYHHLITYPSSNRDCSSKASGFDIGAGLTLPDVREVNGDDPSGIYQFSFWVYNPSRTKDQKIKLTISSYADGAQGPKTKTFAIPRYDPFNNPDDPRIKDNGWAYIGVINSVKGSSNTQVASIIGWATIDLEENSSACDYEGTASQLYIDDVFIGRYGVSWLLDSKNMEAGTHNFYLYFNSRPTEIRGLEESYILPPYSNGNLTELESNVNGVERFAVRENTKAATFVLENPFEFLGPTSSPKQSQLKSPLILKAAKGEIESGAFGFYSGSNMGDGTISAENLRGPSTISSENIEVWISNAQMVSSTQGDGGNQRGYVSPRIINGMLLKDNHIYYDGYMTRLNAQKGEEVKINFSPHETIKVWVTVNIPPCTTPGKYRGMIKIIGSGINLNQQLELEVYPFSIIQPYDALVYTHMNVCENNESQQKLSFGCIWDSPSVPGSFEGWESGLQVPQQTYREFLRALREHGILGGLSISEPTYCGTENALKLLQDEGFRGSTIIDKSVPFGGWNKRPSESVNNTCAYNKSKKYSILDKQRLYKSRDQNLVLYLFDEPPAYDTAFIRKLNIALEEWHNLGFVLGGYAATACCVKNAPCNVSTVQDAIERLYFENKTSAGNFDGAQCREKPNFIDHHFANSRENRPETKEYLYWQFGFSKTSNRVVAGINAYKSKLDGIIPWSISPSHAISGNHAFNSFHGWQASDPSTWLGIYRNPWNENDPGIVTGEIFEAMREGIDDAAYIKTAEMLGVDVENEIKEYLSKEAYSMQDLKEIRDKLAALIIEKTNKNIQLDVGLKSALNGEYKHPGNVTIANELRNNAPLLLIVEYQESLVKTVPKGKKQKIAIAQRDWGAIRPGEVINFSRTFEGLETGSYTYSLNVLAYHERGCLEEGFKKEAIQKFTII